jgi:endonuclease/exonuclease/phosphatase family metal-dependent hydrolase
MYATGVQKFFTYAGYYASGFARESVRSLERLTRPMPQGNEYWTEVAQRVKRMVSLIFSIPLATALAIPAFVCYGLASLCGKGRFELIEAKPTPDFWKERSIKILSLNACLQDPWSPLSGGIEVPFEPVAKGINRIAAMVNAIAKENPAIFMGQEFDNLGAQDEFIRQMKEKGFRVFVRDLGSNDPVRNHSGLLIASQVQLSNVEFVPYPSVDLAGLAKWSRQGALTFTTALSGKNLRLVNVHLNYGEGTQNQQARNRQLTRHVVPLLKRGVAVLFGDLNFNTAAVKQVTSGLFGFVNALERKVTCTDSGKHILRGKSKFPGGKPCTDCEERVDGLLYNPKQIQVIDSQVKQLKLGNKLLSDHFATIATVAIV